MKKPNWIVHLVFDVQESENCGNTHTHGMDQYDHLDFQVVLKVAPNIFGYLLNTMGDRVRNGEKFKTGDMVSGLFEDCDVRLDLFKETGRDVLRLIIPDGDNNFPESPLCKEPYKSQTQIMFE